jgi:hypothetical protein
VALPGVCRELWTAANVSSIVLGMLAKPRMLTSKAVQDYHKVCARINDFSSRFQPMTPHVADCLMSLLDVTWAMVGGIGWIRAVLKQSV